MAGPHLSQNIDAVLLDLGNTLVSYYQATDFEPILERCITEVMSLLEDQGTSFLGLDVQARAKALNGERPDLRVWPLRARLSQIFADGRESLPDELLEAMSQRFLEPIFATGKLDPEAVPVLTALRGARFKIAIVSNTPWGSPGAAWRAELSRRGLLDRVDEAVFCTDAGWRKPAPQIFQRALDGLGVEASRALFVGDDRHWDVQGAVAAGMVPVLYTPTGPTGRTGPTGPIAPVASCLTIGRLSDLLALLGQPRISPQG